MQSRKHKTRPLEAPIRSGNADAILAKLIRITMYDLGIYEEDRYNALMSRYIQRARFLPNADKVEAMRVGLSKELLKENITWKTLIRGYEFLAAEQVDFGVEFEWKGKETYHEVSFLVKEVKEPGLILGKLMSLILHNLNVNEKDYDELVNRYIDRSRAVVFKRQRATLRASVSKELLKPSMTWKNFVSKGLLFLEVKKLTIKTRLLHSRRSHTQHAVVAILEDEGES